MIEPLQPPNPLRADLRSEWLIDPRITFLNHGSFGAVPKCVFVEQTRWRLRIEAEPIELLGRQRPELLRNSKRAIGKFLGMNEDDFGLVTNATEGINAVLRSLSLGAEDELLTTTHVYHAVRQAMKYVAGKTGAGYREVEIPLPVRSAESISDAILNAVSPRTRLVVIDHITSPTALIFPIERIVSQCAARGVDVMIDGAHAPGMLALDVPKVGAAYYAGNLHKWACAPKGSAFLWAAASRRDAVHPLVISHHLGEGFSREFCWQGTRDISGWLAVPRALEFMSEMVWSDVIKHNHAMAAWAQQMLCEALAVQPISPLDGSMLGSMVTVPLPAPLDCLTEEEAARVQQLLYREHHLEVPIVRWGGRSFVRPCCQVYNGAEDYRALAEIVKEVAAEHPTRN